MCILVFFFEGKEVGVEREVLEVVESVSYFLVFFLSDIFLLFFFFFSVWFPLMSHFFSSSRLSETCLLFSKGSQKADQRGIIDF